MPSLCCDRHYLPDLYMHPHWCSKRRPAPEPIADVTFYTHDGQKVKFCDVRVDSIGPSGEQPGVIGVEFNSGDIEIAHVPFVAWWSIDYR